MSLSIFGPAVAAQSSDQLATKPPIPSRRIDAERTGDLTEAPVPAVQQRQSQREVRRRISGR